MKHADLKGERHLVLHSQREKGGDAAFITKSMTSNFKHPAGFVDRIHSALYWHQVSLQSVVRENIPPPSPQAKPSVPFSNPQEQRL